MNLPLKSLEYSIDRKYSEFDLEDDAFEKNPEISDWRLFVPEKLKKHWNDLTYDEKFICALTAEYNIKH